MTVSWFEHLGADRINTLAEKHKVTLTPSLLTFLESFGDLVEKSSRSRQLKRVARAWSDLESTHSTVVAEVERFKKSIASEWRRQIEDIYVRRHVETRLPVTYLRVAKLPLLVIHVRANYHKVKAGVSFGFATVAYCGGRVSGAVATAIRVLRKKAGQREWMMGVSEVMEIWMSVGGKISMVDREGCMRRKKEEDRGRKREEEKVERKKDDERKRGREEEEGKVVKKRVREEGKRGGENGVERERTEIPREQVEHVVARGGGREFEGGGGVEKGWGESGYNGRRGETSWYRQEQNGNGHETGRRENGYDHTQIQKGHNSEGNDNGYEEVLISGGGREHSREARFNNEEYEEQILYAGGGDEEYEQVVAQGGGRDDAYGEEREEGEVVAYGGGRGDGYEDAEEEVLVSGGGGGVEDMDEEGEIVAHGGGRSEQRIRAGSLADEDGEVEFGEEHVMAAGGW